jgi:16S rRNA (cytidine1402-2'-O)-methyltransferase
MPGQLYVVATPIGNLADFSHRAVEILQQVDLIAAEDTRHVRMLLQHYGIQNKVISLHQHNEDRQSPLLVEKMQQGAEIALVSDAGTPLISDPGMPLVKLAQEQSVKVVPVPGACALIAALSAAGMPVSRFVFEGFLPRTSSARKAFFQARQNQSATWVFYESSHRIEAAFADMLTVIEADRECVVARELTKLHETIVKDRLDNIARLVTQDNNMQKGEFVVIVSGAVVNEVDKDAVSEEELRILKLLLKECSVKTAAGLAADITGQRKKVLYQAALAVEKAE